MGGECCTGQCNNVQENSGQTRMIHGLNDLSSNTDAFLSPIVIPASDVAQQRALSWCQHTLLEQTENYTRYRVVEKITGQPAELWTLTEAACTTRPGSKSICDRLQTHLRTLRLSKGNGLQRPLESQLQTPPFQIVLEHEQSLSLEEYLTAKPATDRIGLAFRLCQLTRHSLELGLGLPRDDRFLTLDVEGNWQANWVSQILCGGSAEVDAAETQSRLTQLLRVLLQPLIDHAADQCEPHLSARQRAQWKRYLQSDQSEDQFDVYDWMAILQPSVRSIAEGPVEASGANSDQTEETAFNRQVASPINHGQDASDKTEETDIAAYMRASGDDTPVSAQPMLPIGRAKGRTLGIGEQIGRYQLESKLGQGGMGTVYRAVDLATQQSVAIKFLRIEGQNIAQAVRRFRKEARVLASIQNDFVTRLIEVGEIDGHHFLVMELFEGTNLKAWLQQHGPFVESSALRIVADVARGLADVHRQGIVHRDLKPDNILVQTISADQPESQALLAGDQPCRVKITDFGIARSIEQSQSMEVTRAGALLGTPIYMSPEQFKGANEISTATDVYSLGVILYELLVGAPPFFGHDPMKLAAMHCFDPVPPIQRIQPQVSDATAALLQRMLAKSTSERYTDAQHVLIEIDRLIRGEPSAIEMHPRPPGPSHLPVWERTFSWDLASSPAQLWPFVSNTERLNRAIGLPPVTYRTELDPVHGPRKFGTFRLGAIQIAWEEHPFEWIEGQRMGILREFSQGPFEWFMSVVELQPLATGGTKLIHRVRIQPRNQLGKWVATIEADWKGRRQLDRTYRRIDRSIQGKLTERQGSDPFEPPPKLTRVQRERLTRRAESLAGHGVSTTIVERLTSLLTESAPQALAQLRPLLLAEQWKVSGDEVIEAMLQATADGLLTLHWEVLCPTCRAPAETHDVLKEIQQHTHCEACASDFRSNLGEAIELVFRAHPEIRSVDTASYCIGGPEHAPHVIAQVKLSPHETIDLDIDLRAGEYLMRGPRLARQQLLKVRCGNAAKMLDLSLSRLGDLAAGCILQEGRQTLRVTNDYPSHQLVRIERWIPRQHVVTATVATSLPRFRKLFPEQRFAESMAIASEEMAVLATDVVNSESVYRRFGDADAYALIQRQWQICHDLVLAHRGCLAKSAGEGLVAVFRQVDWAVNAAVEIKQRLMQEPTLSTLEVGVGVHYGKMLISTQVDRLDYFGATARAAQALPTFAASAEFRNQTVLLTEKVYLDPQVRLTYSKQLQSASIQTIDLPGRPATLVQALDCSEPHVS